VGAVKANWHLDALDLSDDDPMQGDIAHFGKPIDLSKSIPELREDLRYMVRKEARYHNNGLSCDLKWTAPGPSGPYQRNPCYTCPHYQDEATITDDNHMHLLCRLGRQQNDALDMLGALVDVQRKLDAELVAAHEREVAEVEEFLQAAA
jgi:hypothetical protein